MCRIIKIRLIIIVMSCSVQAVKTNVFQVTSARNFSGAFLSQAPFVKTSLLMTHLLLKAVGPNDVLFPGLIGSLPEQNLLFKDGVLDQHIHYTSLH